MLMTTAGRLFAVAVVAWTIGCGLFWRETVVTLLKPGPAHAADVAYCLGAIEYGFTSEPDKVTARCAGNEWRTEIEVARGWFFRRMVAMSDFGSALAWWLLGAGAIGGLLIAYSWIRRAPQKAWLTAPGS